MAPLRILHVVPYYEQAWAYGGIPRLATTMTRALARRGHHVTVCTTDARDERTRAAYAARCDDVEVRAYPNLSNHLAYRWQLFAPVGLAAYLRRALAAGLFDVAHVHACHNLPGAIAARLAAAAGVPYVVSPNGTARPIERRVLAKRLFAGTVGRDLLPRAARVIAVTAAERDQLRALGVAPSRIAVVPNPIDEREFDGPADPSGFRQRHGVGAGRLVMFLGKLTPRKGVEVLVQALGRMSDQGATLVVAGNDMGSARSIDAAIRAAGVHDRILLIGLLEAGARRDALAAADVVVYPSRDEIFGLVPLEALMCGAPVVVCDDSGCGEVIAAVGGGLRVPHGDAEALACAIDSILVSPELWRGRAAAAERKVRARFGSEAIVRQLEALYRDVCPTPRGARHEAMA